MIVRELRSADVARVAAMAAGDASAAHWAATDYESIAAGQRAQLICLVAEDSGSVVGMALASFAADEAELLNIVVPAERRRCGVGSALLDDIMSRVARQGARRMWLEVRQSNRGAIEFYTARGFETRGQRPGYYSDPAENALVMALDLEKKLVV